MAKTKDQIKTEYPLPVYNYRVEIGTTTIAFAEVSGLSIVVDTTTYKESPTATNAPGPRVFHMPAQGTPVNITLRKGVVREAAGDMNNLYNWINSIAINQVDKRDVKIHLCDETGEAVITWTVSNAFPVRLEAPTFDANSNEVAIETVELMGDGVKIEGAGRGA
jgi:phage tail-like protein